MMLSSIRWMCVVVLLMTAAPGTALALSPPHNTDDQAWSITCVRCHYAPVGPPPAWVNQPTTTDNTFFNNLCTDCHAPGKLTISAYEEVKTHSAQTMSSSYGGGAWSLECRVCHSPHYQQQALNYPSEPGVNLLTGTITSLASAPGATVSRLTDATQSFIPNQYSGYLLVPNIAYPARIYRILSNTNTTFTVHSAINLNYTAVGKTYAIRYGKLINSAITTPYSGVYQVKFFNNAGPNSFGTCSSAASMTSICQICHSRTLSFNNSGVLEGPGHPSAKAGTDCTNCHAHKDGFKPTCGSCHGDPPSVATLGGPDGLAINDGGTGATNPGAHRRHAISLAYPCTTCHTGGMPASPVYDKKIQIGFDLLNGAYQGGAYDGRTSLANGYTYTAGGAGTTLTNGGTKACSNIYCHGTAMAPNGGTDTTPAWDNPSTAACGTCHGAAAANPPTRGSHLKHAQTYLSGYKYACGLCHQDPNSNASLHVNNRSEVIFSSDPKTAGGAYGGTPAMLDAYGTCTNVYCHSTVQSSPPGAAPVYRTTPVWGGNLIMGCSECHEYVPTLASGSHGKHMLQPELQECWPCHNYNNTDDPCNACHDSATVEPQRDKHANHSINVAFAPKYGGSYSGSPVPGDAYGTCSTVYCHSTVQGNPDPTQLPTYRTPTWGQSFSGVCGNGACHPVGNAHQGDTGYAPLTTGSHAKHLLYRFDQEGNCQSCHYDVSYGGCVNCHSRALNHPDKNIDVTFNPSFPAAAGGASGSYSGDAVPRTAYGACSALYCHSPGTKGSPPYSSPNTTAAAWGGTLPNDCTGCHHGDRNTARPMSTGSHGRHVSSYLFDCSVCHVTTVSDSRMISQAVYFGNQTLGYRNHANGWVNVAFSTGTTSAGTYAGQASPVDYRVPGSAYGACGNTYCHSNGTGGTANAAPGGELPPLGDPRPLASNASATWGTAGPLGCSSCHGHPPSYSMDQPKANSHINGFHEFFGCNVCHYATTTNGTSIANSANHANGIYDLQPDPAATYSGIPVSFAYVYDPGGGRCNTISCHTGGSTFWGYGASGTALVQALPTSNCNELSLSAYYSPASAGVVPISYYWTFGDGTPEFQGSSPVVHVYPGLGPFYASVRGRDSNYRPYQSGQTQVWPQQSNALPAVNETISVNRYTVTLTDLSTDADSATCGHSGNGQLQVTWGTTGYIDTVPNVPLSTTPTNVLITRTFASPTSMNVAHSVTDNAGASAGKVIYNVSVPGPIAISGTVTYSSGTPFSGVTMILKTTGGSTLATAATDTNGRYSFSRAWVDNCYLVQPNKTGYSFTPATLTVCAIASSADFQAN